MTVCANHTAPMVEKLTKYARYEGHWSASALSRSCPEPLGTPISSTSNVIAMENTPSLNPSMRAVR